MTASSTDATRIAARSATAQNRLAAQGTASFPAFLLSIPLAADDAIEFRLISTEPMVVAVPAGHGLACRETVALEELRDVRYLRLHGAGAHMVASLGLAHRTDGLAPAARNLLALALDQTTEE